MVNDTHIEADIEKDTDINKFADLGIQMTPGLILNDNVYHSGRVPGKATLTLWLDEAIAAANQLNSIILLQILEIPFKI